MKHILLTLMALTLPIIALHSQEYRSIDGYGNNPANPDWGAAGVMLERLTSNGYADGISEMGGKDRPNPREISNFLFAQTGVINDKLTLSDYVWVFGQFLDHEITLTENNVSEPLLIPVPAGDPMFDPFETGNVVIPMFRSHYHPETGTSPENPRTHTNAITAFIDGSAIYGSDYYRGAWLRSYVDGKLRVSEGNLLPFNTLSGEFNSPRDPGAPFMADDTHSGEKLFVAGDIRANENPLLLSFHTLFVREHNRLCDVYRAKHPDWSDEELYQHARSFLIGLMQSVTYHEWLPAMGVHLDPYTGYKQHVNPGIYNVFSAAAFRLGHTLLNGNIMRTGYDGEVIPQGNLNLRDAFFKSKEILLAGGIDPYFKGMGVQIQQELDCKVIDDVRNFLFGPPGAGGLDLAAINIMRGRERGLPDFNTIRADLGMTKATGFSQICGDGPLSADLAALYNTVDNIDPWVGMLAEDHMPQALFGETIMHIMKKQFTNLRDGDRFYFEGDPELSRAEISEIKATLLSDIIMRNTHITLMQKDVFHAMDHDNIPFSKAVVFERELDLAVFPNPIEESVNCKVYTFHSGQADIQVFNTLGEEVYATHIQLREGENTFSLPVGTNLAPGTYAMRIALGNADNTVLLVKQ